MIQKSARIYLCFRRVIAGWKSFHAAAVGGYRCGRYYVGGRLWDFWLFETIVSRTNGRNVESDRGRKGWYGLFLARINPPLTTLHLLLQTLFY